MPTIYKFPLFHILIYLLSISIIFFFSSKSLEFRTAMRTITIMSEGSFLHPCYVYLDSFPFLLFSFYTLSLHSTTTTLHPPPPPSSTTTLTTSYLKCDPTHGVSYENINMDYISGLCHEGFNKPAVVRALLISRNDVTLARDILQVVPAEFIGNDIPKFPSFYNSD